MVFKRMLAAFGVGGPTVDTVLDTPHVRPGQVLTGQVRIQGGSAEAEIDRVELSLVTGAEAEHGDHEVRGVAEFLRVTAAERVRVAPNERRDLAFALPVPWEAPITAVGGTPLRGMTVGVRTDLVVSGAPDKGDLDPVAVHPLPSQDAVLGAFAELGFRFRSADVEIGRLYGVPQELNLYQEIEFLPPPQVAGSISEVELTFVATSHELHVVLEAGRRGGFLRPEGDTFGRFSMTHPAAEGADWAGLVRGWVTEAASRHQSHAAAFGGHDPHRDPYGHHGHHGRHGHRGHGAGSIVGAAAGGLVGGMILGEVAEEVFGGGEEDFGGEE